ncbi:MAG: nitrilase-related carbon-nitrogen hydrolase [Caldilineaceae bacterium]
MNLLSLLWLMLGGLLSAFSFSSRWTIPLAAWLAPLCLLHFVRTQAPLPGLIGVWLVSFLALYVSQRDVIPVPGMLYPAITAGMATLALLPYLADRLLAPRLPGFAGLFIFPLVWTIAEFSNARFNPFGSWGSVAYTQYGNLPLMQLAAVTGIWGITFLIAWFAAVVNWAWDNAFIWASIRTEVLVYAAVWSLVMLLGGFRLAFAPDPPTVRVAGIGLPEGVLEMSERMHTYDPALPDSERRQVSQRLMPLQTRLLAESQREAQAGAKIVVWHETAAPVFLEDEPALIERGQQLVREEGIYLLMGLGTIHKGGVPRIENKAVLLTPAGEVAFAYRKNRPLPGEEALLVIRGDGKIGFQDTPYGRIAVAICSDLDYPFPPLIRQVSQTRADLFLVPASDWAGIKHLHPQQAAFRAIENGVAVVRPARWGISMSFDAYGRVLASQDHFTTNERVLVAQVPTQGVQTIYGRVSDLFAWLCVVALTLGVVAMRGSIFSGKG